jgi:hypothetical protein
MLGRAPSVALQALAEAKPPASASPALRIPATPEARTIAAERLTMGELRPDSAGWQGQGMLDRWIKSRKAGRE